VVREALVLDSNDDLAPQLAKMLSDNGYVVRVLATRSGRRYSRRSLSTYTR
jgi:trk system potassium uptake protein TrkA